MKKQCVFLTVSAKQYKIGFSDILVCHSSAMPSSRPCPWGLPGRPSRARGQLVHVHTASISCWWSSSASRWSSLYSRLLSWSHTYPVVVFKCSIILFILLSHVVEGGIAHMPRWGISSLRPVERISISIKLNSTLVAAIAIVTVIFRFGHAHYHYVCLLVFVHAVLRRNILSLH